MQVPPKVDRAWYKQPIFNLDSLLASPTLEIPVKGMYTMPLGRGHLDVILDIRPGKPMVVFFGAAIQKKTNRFLPWFSGTGLLAGRDVSKVLISDPTLYLDERLNLAWYAGAKDIDAQGTICRVLEKLASIAQPSKVMCIGGSGGGYAALHYAGRFENWLAVAWNPQTNIFAYIPKAVERYLSFAWDMKNIDAAHAYLRDKVMTDVYKLYSLEKKEKFVLYIQNESDSHVQDHLLPFMAQYESKTPTTGLISESFYLKMENFGEGHIAPPKEYLFALLNGLLADEQSWAEIFAEGVLPQILSMAQKAQAAAKLAQEH